MSDNFISWCIQTGQSEIVHDAPGKYVPIIQKKSSELHPQVRSVIQFRQQHNIFSSDQTTNRQIKITRTKSNKRINK